MADEARRVMIEDRYTVPAIPASDLAAAFGQTKQDPKVEFAVLTFEYWKRSGATLSLQREQMLRVLPKTLTTSIAAFRFVRLLALRGDVAEFFELVNPSIDRDMRLRRLLDSLGIDRDTIRYYAAWNGLSLNSFAAGFLLGVTESATSIVFDVYHLGELVWRLDQAEFRWLIKFAADPAAAAAELVESLRTVVRALGDILSLLDPRAVPDRILATWRGWNEEFARHLEELDAEAAGRQLGMLAGTLWQLLTGLVAVAHIIQLAGRGALRYGSLALGSVRAAAKESQLVLRDVAAIIMVWTAKVVDALPRVGLWFLHTLFPPRVISQLLRDGRALVCDLRLSLVLVPEPAYAAAASGRQMLAPLAVAVVRADRPLLMASLSETLPSAAGAGRAVESADQALFTAAEIDRFLEGAFKEGKAAEDALDAAVIAATRMEQLNQRLLGRVRKLLHETSVEVFVELKAAGGKQFNPATLGSKIDARMRPLVEAEVAAAAPGALVRTELTTAGLVDLLSQDPRSAGKLAQDAKAALNETVASLVMKDPETLKLLGVPATARSEAEVAAVLKKQFGWTQDATTLGELRSDLVIGDIEASIIRNVDYTSSTKVDKFTQAWNELVTDLKGSFTGDPDAVEKAYRAAHGAGVPPEIKKRLLDLSNHALRETVVRRLALQRVLGPGWYISSQELFYDSFRQLFDTARAMQ